MNYGVDADWSLTLRLPIIRRHHEHDLIDNTTGLPSTPQQWPFTKLVDVQLLARRQFLSEDATAAFALFGGLKLPTGSSRVTNLEALERKER